MAQSHSKTPTHLAPCLADIAKALHNIGLVLEARQKTDLGHERGLVDKVVDAVVNTTTSSRRSSVDASLQNWLAGHTSERIDVRVAKGVGVCVGYPCHFSLASAHVWRGHVNARSNESLFGQLNGKTARNSLQLSFRILFWIDLYAGFSAAKRNVNTCTFESHQSRECFYFVNAHIFGVADSSLAWCTMLGVLRSPSFDDLKFSVVSFDRKSHLQNVVAWLDHLQNSFYFVAFYFGSVARLHFLDHFVLDNGGRSVIEHLDHFVEVHIVHRFGRSAVRTIANGWLSSQQRTLEHAAIKQG
ncbi:hypothetical protein BpHYR1_002411 [Brachionus plicatilis]|uniref:Uncharacterized protein n=1 Tax=Brachionus plicatilis TaxID=10195 RepID=A0A3M7PMI1_BRAPC|nr:hypothetical protein BpHYR1_002411 [Brachionus plicatilis]